jgi:hypothetical protein
LNVRGRDSTALASILFLVSSLKKLFAVWQFADANGACRCGRNRKTGSPRAAKRVDDLARYLLRLLF